MVFTSLPLYLDPPNWNQQNHHHHQSGSGDAGNELQQAIQVMTPTLGAPANGGSIRPGPMSDRPARMAKIPCLQPEQALKCPRCDSANTKFCYFNNYSLSQPRHFCKTCRRYWTRGGALRNVPVGGGCRRSNKRSKSSRSSSSSSSATTSSSTATSGGSTVMPSSNYPHHLPYLPSLHAMSEYGAPNLGLQFAAMQPDAVEHAANYQLGGGGSTALGQWRIQQFPFLGGLASSSTSSAAVMTTAPAGGSIYNPFDDGERGFNGEVVLPKETSSALISQLASVKMEDSINPDQGLNLARQYLGISGKDHYWSGGGNGVDTNSRSWAPDELPGFNSSSSGNFL